jgi:hypothetical protein
LVALCLASALSYAAEAGSHNPTRLIGVLPLTPGGTDYQAYYDPETNLTWLADANANGLMNYVTAKQWAASLNINGITGWRLPKTAQPDPSCTTQIGGLSRGYNCIGSELGRMYYKVLGNPGLCDQDGNCPVTKESIKNKNGVLQNVGPFKHLQPEYYWSETEFDDPDSAWYLDFRYGDQRDVNKIYPMYAWAVHDGNVGKAKLPDNKPFNAVPHDNDAKARKRRLP